MHITFSRTLLLLLVAGITPSCDESFEPHCHRDEDCRPGETCNVVTNQCSTSDVDAGDAGPDAGDATPDAGDATTCDNSTECTTDEAPICVVDTCEPCTTPAQCENKDSTFPACVGGECLECSVSETHCNNPADPICNAGVCEPCDTALTECPTHQPGTAVCLAGECVQCTDSALHCTDPNPICDLTTNNCRSCNAHSECDFLTGLDAGICDWDTRTCVAEADTIYVDVNGLCNPAGQGTFIEPFCQIHEAWAEVAGTRNTILVASGTYEPISVNNSNLPRIVTHTGAEIAVGSGQSVVDVAGGNTELIVEGFVIRNAITATYFGVACSGFATLTLLNNEIHSNDGGGVNALNCTLNMEGNIVRANSGGGVRLELCDYTVINNIIYSNGLLQASHGGVILDAAATQVFAHNTVVDNLTTGPQHAGVRCNSPVEIVNSIVYANANLTAGTGCTLTDNWMSPMVDPDLDADRKLNSGSGCIGFSPAYSGVSFDIDGQPSDPVLADTGADEYYP